MEKNNKLNLKFQRIFSAHDVAREYSDLICPYIDDNSILIPTLVHGQFLRYDLQKLTVNHPEHPSEFYEVISCENDHLRSLVYELISDLLSHINAKATDNYAFSNAIFTELISHLLTTFGVAGDYLNLRIERMVMHCDAEQLKVLSEYQFFLAYIANRVEYISFDHFTDELVDDLISLLNIKHPRKKVYNLVRAIRKIDCRQFQQHNKFGIISILGVVMEDLLTIDFNRVPHIESEMTEFINLSMFIDEISASMTCGASFFTMKNVVRFVGTWRDTANDFYDLMEEDNLDVSPLDYVVKMQLLEIGNTELLAHDLEPKSTRNKFVLIKKLFYNYKIQADEEFVFSMNNLFSLICADLSVTPISTSREIHEYGMALNNCLHQFVDKMKENESIRVIVVKKGDKILSAAELSYSHYLNRWLCVQHKARFNGLPSVDANTVVDEYIALLNK